MEFNLLIIVLLIAMLVYLVLHHFIWENDRFVHNQHIKHLSLLLYIAMFFFVGVYIFESKTLLIDTTTVTMVLSLFMLMIGVNIIMVTFFSSWVIDITTSRQRVVTLF